MRLATLAVLVLMLCMPLGAQPLTFARADGPWLPASIRYAAGDGFVLARSGFAGTLHRSYDGGGTWEPLPEAPDVRGVQSYQGGLVAGSPSGLVRSYDNGSTWTTVAFDGVSVSGIAAPDSLYLQDATGQLYRSGGDLGRWTPLDLPTFGGFAPFAAAPGGRLAHLDRYVDSATDLRLSDDYGETFTTHATWWPPAALAFVEGTLYGVRSTAYTFFELPGGLFRFDGGDAGFTQVRSASAVGPIRRQPDGRLTYTADGVVRRLAGGGAIGTPSAPGPVADAVFFPSSTLVVGAEVYGPPPFPDGSISRRTAFGMLIDRGDGLVHTGFAASPAAAVARASEGGLLVGAGGDVYRFDRGWRALGTGVPDARAFVPLWGDSDSLVVLADYGEQTGFTVGPTPVIVDGEVIAIPEFEYACDEGSMTALTFVGDRGILACGGYLGYNTLRTVDRGDFPQYRLNVAEQVTSLLTASDGRTFAGASAGPWEDEPVEVPVRVSDDLGETWTEFSAGLNGERVFALVEHDGVLFAGTASGIFRLDGMTWLRDLDAPGVAVFARGSATLFAGAAGEVFERTGGTWQPVAEGLDGASVRGLLVQTDGDGRWAVVGTDRGVFTTRPGRLVGADDAPAAVAAPTLRAAPNPARGTVTFTLAGFAASTVEVLDVLGRMVARLDVSRDGTVRWDAAAVPAGVYLARTPDGAASARVTVVR